MQNKALSNLAMLFITVLSASGQMKLTKLNPVGTWNFEAQYAPEGYQTGTIIVGQEAKQLTASMSFTGSEYKIPGEKVKQAGDSLQFAVYLEGEVISIALKMESNIKMSGKAVYSEGEVPLALTKQDAPTKK
jgi:hypothetical protein